jgi:hypothetical protein
LNASGFLDFWPSYFIFEMSLKTAGMIKFFVMFLPRQSGENLSTSDWPVAPNFYEKNGRCQNRQRP